MVAVCAGWGMPLMCSSVMGKGFQQRGQSMIEGLIALPFFLFFIAALVQLIWMLLAQHLLNSAARYVALHESTVPGSVLEQQAVFYSRMKPLPGRGVVIPLIDVLQYDQEQLDLARLARQQNEGYLQELDYVHIQLHQRNEEQAEKWLEVAVVPVRVRWCFPLRVPWIGSVFLQFDRLSEVEHRAYCQAYAVAGTPHFPLYAVSRVPLRATRVWRPATE